MTSYPILGLKPASLNEFVSFWSSIYGAPSVELLYNDCIHKKQFSEDDVVQLYVWKNGTVLSGPKKESLEKNILFKISVINELKKNYNEETFQANFKDVSTIWKIFLKHIISPEQFPIFDQHVFRSCWYLTTGEIKEIEDVLTDAIPNSLKEWAKEDIYTTKYLPFIRQFSEGDVPLKKIDEALMAFGRFLKNDFSKALPPLKPS